MEKQAGLRLFSLGIVTENKTRESDYILACPIESLSMGKGSLSPDSKQYATSLPDTRGVAKNANLQGGQVIKAKWIPYGESNRDSAPDVYKSETVLLFTYADTNEYYWTTVFREPSLRRKEDVLYRFSNQPGGLAEYTDDTSYWMRWNTFEQFIHLHTSSNDGEPTDYDITVNTREGVVTVVDQLGNQIELDSVAGKLTATIREDIELNTKRMVVNASDSVTINTPITTLTGNLRVNQNISASGSIIDGGGNTPNHSH